jgi:NIMA (never in mitosis gene a)-related kinase
VWKLTDFGISGPALSKGVTTKFSRGTPCYRAPELLDEQARFTEKVDIWALGCILYEVATGDKAFSGGGSRQVTQFIRFDVHCSVY